MIRKLFEVMHEKPVAKLIDTGFNVENGYLPFYLNLVK